MESHTRVIGIRPPKLAPNGRQVRESQNNLSQASDRTNRSEAGTRFGNVVDVPGVLAFADADASTALHIETVVLASSFNHVIIREQQKGMCTIAATKQILS